MIVAQDNLCNSERAIMSNRSKFSMSCMHMLLLETAIFALALAQAIPAQETLRSLAQKRGLYIGVAINSLLWSTSADPKYSEIVKREFNIIVTENEMKFDQIEPQRGQFNWTKADLFIDYVQKNQMQARGHNLVWHQQSGWAENLAVGRVEMLAILKNHTDKVLGRYRGKIMEWDVVNEAIDDASGNLRETFWKKAIGEDYIDSAFHYAHLADPEALLFYNDYSAEGMGSKSDKVYALVKGMKERGVPIHGVGLQSHFDNNSWTKPSDIDKNIKRLGELGLRVSITELDFRVKVPADTASLNKQKANYRTLLGVCLANANCKSFLTWGFTDAHSWVPGFYSGMGAALIYDSQYLTKPAYDGLKDALLTVSLLPNHQRQLLLQTPFIRFQPWSETSPRIVIGPGLPSSGIFNFKGQQGKRIKEER
jgi:endo-1,4-beta-xylanase